MTGIYGRESMAERLGITRGLEVSRWSGGIIWGHARWIDLPPGVTLKWARWAACVWSCFRPPEANLSSCKRFAYVMRHVWGDYMVTSHIGGRRQFLLDLCWRVWKWSSNYGQVEQISNCKLFSGGKWLLRLIYWLGVKIPERYWSWVALWGWPNILWPEVNNYLPI